MLSILVLSWNTKDLTRECLRSIKSELGGFEYEVVVIDNASEDGSAQMIESEFPDYLLVKNSKNVGFAEGNNQAYKLSKGDQILMLNSDTVVNREAIEGMYAFLDNASCEYAATTCRLCNVDGTTQYYMHRRFPSAIRLILALLHKRFPVFKPKIVRDYLYLNGELDADFDIAQAAAACLMVTRDYIEEFGLLDEKRFPIYYNDVDFCMRVKKNSLKIRYFSGLSIVHVKGQSVGKLSAALNSEYYIKASLLFFKKHSQFFSYAFLKLLYSTLYLFVFFLSFPLMFFGTKFMRPSKSFQLFVLAVAT